GAGAGMEFVAWGFFGTWRLGFGLFVRDQRESRSSLFSKVSFHKNYSQGFWIWRGDQSEHVGAMLLDLCKVLFSIVSRTIANHRADNLQPTMSQAAESARVALSLISVAGVESLFLSTTM